MAGRSAKEAEQKVYALHAGVCQLLANPTRLKILNTLREQEMAAGDLARKVGVRKANLSQHLAVLRERKIVVARREGTMIHYRIANPKILRAFDIMREILFEQLAEGSRILRAYGSPAAKIQGSKSKGGVQHG